MLLKQSNEFISSINMLNDLAFTKDIYGKKTLKTVDEHPMMWFIIAIL